MVNGSIFRIWPYKDAIFGKGFLEMMESSWKKLKMVQLVIQQ